MTFRITILCDNSVGPVSSVLGEHGFAALVEGPEGSLLFDTGQGETLVHNAVRLNRDLHRVPRVVLSHGHYDHTGGLWQLLRMCGTKEVFAHPDLFRRRYRVKDTGEAISIGIPYSREFLEGAGARFSFGSGWRSLGDGLFLTGEIPRVSPFETGDAGLFCDDAGCEADTVSDDQSLVLKTPRGLVILVGCCHAGLVNTIEHAREKSGVDEVYAVIGGTHLGFCGGEQLEQTVQALRRYGVRKIAGSHCTGHTPAARLAAELPGRFHPAQVGYFLEI